MEALSHDSLRIGDRVFEIERGDSVEDCIERISLVFAGCASEAMQTFAAAEHLQGAHAVAPLAFLDGVFAAALWTDRVWYLKGC